jgi:hypothetical protein
MIDVVETLAMNGGVIGEVLSHEPHSEVIVSNEATMTWSNMCGRR